MRDAMAVRRARPEQQLQKAVLDHLRWRAVPGTFAFHPANGGWRSAVEARILKSQGVVAGVPDVIILRDGKTYGQGRGRHALAGAVRVP